MPTFQNQATLYSNNSVIRSNIVTGQINEVLTITKTAVDNDYVQGENVTYVITLVNSSSSPLTGLTLTDDLGEYTFGTAPDEITLYPLSYTDGSVLYYTNGTLQPSPAVTGTQPMVITGITVPAGGNATIVYETTADVFAPPTVDGSITNTVTVSSETISATADETITSRQTPELTITKSLEPTTVNELDSITYTFLIQNHGNTAAETADGVYIVDEFDPAVTLTEVTYESAPFTEYTYTDGVFTTNVGAITVPAATYEQDGTTGAWIIIPGVATLTVTGTI